MLPDSPVERFVLHFFHLWGAIVTTSGPHLYEVELDCDLQNFLGLTTRHFIFTFRREALASDRQAVLLFSGHPCVERMVGLARSRGDSARFIFWDRYTPEQAEKRLYQLWGNGRITLLNRRFVYQRQILFDFRTAFLADERMEKVFSLLMDPITETPGHLIDLAGALPLPSALSPASPAPHSRAPHPQSEHGQLPQAHHRTGQQALVSRQIRATSGRKEPAGKARTETWQEHRKQLTSLIEVEDYTLQRLYRRACEYLYRRLQAEGKEMEAEVRKQQEADRQRLERYYQDLKAEAMQPLRRLIRKLAAASVRVDLARSYTMREACAQRVNALRKELQAAETAYQQRLRALEEERQWRLNELRARSTTKIEVCLIAVAVVYVPRIELTFRLVADKARRELTCLYSCLQDRFIDTACEICEKPAQLLYLCRCGQIVCSACFNFCPGCNREVCRECSHTTCHICGRLVCSDCLILCPYTAGNGEQARSACLQETMLPVCPVCHARYCRSCLALATFGLN